MRSEQHHEHPPLLQDAGVIVGFIVTGLLPESGVKSADFRIRGA